MNKTPAAQLAAAARWRKRNPERMKAYKRAAYVAHPRPPKDPTAPRRAKKAYKLRNPEKVRADSVRRRAREAAPAWADREAIRLYYLGAKLLRSRGLDAEVDHILPLRGKTVCGLHVENNLQLRYTTVNRAKGNRMPEHPQ